MNRRNFLKIAGSAGVILAAGGTGFVITRKPFKALEPWNNAGSLYTDPLRKALSYAILAPNPHNRQPWIVELKSEREAILTCDLNRLLPVTDPFSRQIVIGLGCFLELFSIAAKNEGYHAEITYFPEGAPESRLDHRPIARLILNRRDGGNRDPLFNQVLSRHTNRNPYDTTRPVKSAVLHRLHDVAGKTVSIGSVNSGPLLDDLRTLTRDAMWAEIKTHEANHESVELMRIGRREIEANPDGISLGGPFLETLSLAGILSREALADPSSSAFQTGIDMVESGAMSSMGFVWINTRENGREDQIEAGRAYMRITLQAAADHLSMQPMSQALQEYSAMAPFYKIVHSRLKKHPDERVQMLARLGYTADTDPAPRWPLDTRLKSNMKES